jgi:hypothetical protein
MIFPPHRHRSTSAEKGMCCDDQLDTSNYRTSGVAMEGGA